MAATLLQHPSATSYSGASSVQITFAGACTSNSQITALGTQENDTGTMSVADTVNTYTEDVESPGGHNTFAGNGRSLIAQTKNSSTSALTLTMTLGGNDHGIFDIYEHSGQDLTTPLDSSGGTVGGGLGSDDLISVTSTTANCFGFRVGTYIVSVGQTIDGTPAWSQGKTQTGINLSYHQSEYIDDVGAAGAYSTTFTSTTANTGWSGAMAFYKLDSGGGGGASIVPVLMAHYRQRKA